MGTAHAAAAASLASLGKVTAALDSLVVSMSIKQYVRGALDELTHAATAIARGDHVAAVTAATAAHAQVRGPNVPGLRKRRR